MRILFASPSHGNEYILDLILFRRKRLKSKFIAYREVNDYYKKLGITLYTDLLTEHQEMEYSISELLSKRPVSRSVLFRVFKLVIGVPPNIVRKDSRLFNFKKKLTSSNTSINHLFLESGFKSKSHLYRLFQEIFEMSPKEFRNKYHTSTKNKQRK